MKKILLMLIILLPLEAPCIKLSEQQQVGWVERIEKYFDDIITYKANFLEISGTTVKSGTIYIHKASGVLRVEYNNPSDIVIMSGDKIIQYDSELKEKTELPSKISPFNILFQKDIKLIGKVDITDVKVSGDILEVTFKKAKSSDNDEGSLSITFTINPFELRNWTIIQGGRRSDVVINILDFQHSVRLNPQDIADITKILNKRN